MPRRFFPALLLVAAGTLAACGSKASPFGDAKAGYAAFLTTCTTCHGADAKGIPGLGKDLTTSEFLRGQTDEQTLAFLLTGRRADDPLNTTGVDMPPKGNNPALSEDDLKNIIAYLRTIQP